MNPVDARNTDSCLLLGGAGEVTHNYQVEDAAPGNLWFRWIHGSQVAAKNNDPRIQVMQYNEDTYVLRQNICVDWRGAFTYLLFGNERALLIDCGPTAEPQWYPLRATVEAICARWQGIRRKPAVPLLAALTSAENRDQNRGLVQFAGHPAFQVVPNVGNPIDLGGRILDVLQTPGTHRDGLTFYDRYTKHLFTGDLLFPGRIQIANERDYAQSLERLRRWKEAHMCKWVMGNRVDMQFIPGHAYGRFATFKPYERDLQLLPAAIDRALVAAKTIAGQHTVVVDQDFWLLHGVGPDERPETMPANLPKIPTPRPV